MLPLSLPPPSHPCSSPLPPLSPPLFHLPLFHLPLFHILPLSPLHPPPLFLSTSLFLPSPPSLSPSGFQTPILHGLCSYGIATRHIVREYCGDDVTKVKCIKARFSKPVLPGDTIQTDMWKEGNRIHFVCKVRAKGPPPALLDYLMPSNSGLWNPYCVWHISTDRKTLCASHFIGGQ